MKEGRRKKAERRQRGASASAMRSPEKATRRRTDQASGRLNFFCSRRFVASLTSRISEMARGEEVFLVATNQLEHNYSPESSLPAAQHASCVEKDSDRLVVSTPAIGITLYDVRAFYSSLSRGGGLKIVRTASRPDSARVPHPRPRLQSFVSGRLALGTLGLGRLDQGQINAQDLGRRYSRGCARGLELAPGRAQGWERRGRSHKGRLPSKSERSRCGRVWGG